jgi:hypothetical protein
MRSPVVLECVAYLGGGDPAGGDVDERETLFPFVDQHDVDVTFRPVVNSEASDVRPRNPADGATPADDEVVGVGPHLEAEGGDGEEGNDREDSAEGDRFGRSPSPGQDRPNRRRDAEEEHDPGGGPVGSRCPVDGTAVFIHSLIMDRSGVGAPEAAP